MVTGDWHLVIPDDNMPIATVTELIRDYLVIDYRLRPSFIENLHWLKTIEFKVKADMNSRKIVEFIQTIEDNEWFWDAQLIKDPRWSHCWSSQFHDDLNPMTSKWSWAEGTSELNPRDHQNSSIWNTSSNARDNYCEINREVDTIRIEHQPSDERASNDNTILGQVLTKWITNVLTI